MVIDSQEIFSDKQAVLGAAVVSTNSFKFGKGDALLNPVLIVEVEEDFAGGTSLDIALETAADSGFASPTTLLKVSPVTANLKKGNRVVVARVPYGNLGWQQLRYTPAGTFTAGKISAYFAPQVDVAN
jgi:hypothetical protein